MSYQSSLSKFHAIGVICLVFSVPMSASAQNPTPRYLVDDGDPPMSAVIGYATIGSDSAIVVDNTHGIFLFVSDRREKIIGQRGRGACEHQRVKSFSVDGDTIFVLDNQLGRIIGYSIHSGDCVSEIGMPELSDFAQIGRFDNRFYLAKTEYTSASASDDDEEDEEEGEEEGEEEVGHVHHVMEEEVVEHLDVKEGEEVLIF